MTDLPYVLSNGKVADLLDAIVTAGRPDRFSQTFLEKLGFESSNDRAFISLFRKLGLIGDQGAPTPLYDDLRDPSKRGLMLAQQIKSLYSELFSINQNMQSAPDAELRGAIARVTGRDESITVRIANTFKALAAQANFASPAKLQTLEAKTVTEVTPPPAMQTKPAQSKNAEFHYNIQIILPATTEISVYNAIFKSIKDNLGI